jgi:exodeoxyribonuclease VII small subunit
MEKLSFEESIKELEKIVSELEAPNLTLDESVKKFEKGMELSKHCNELLEKAEKSITILIEKSNGEVDEEAFEVPNA